MLAISRSSVWEANQKPHILFQSCSAITIKEGGGERGKKLSGLPDMGFPREEVFERFQGHDITSSNTEVF